MTTANNKNNNNKTTKSITKTAQKTIRMNLVAVNQAASCKKLSLANNSTKNSAWHKVL